MALGQGPALDVKDIWLSSLEAEVAQIPAIDADAYKPVWMEEIEKQHIAHARPHRLEQKPSRGNPADRTINAGWKSKGYGIIKSNNTRSFAQANKQTTLKTF